MSYVKKVFRLCLFLFLVTYFLGHAALADTVPLPGEEQPAGVMERLERVGKEAAVVPITEEGSTILPAYLGRVVRGALALLGVIFFALMVYGGFLWLYAGGNEEQVKKAKNIITRAAIGFLIVVFAGGIVQFVMTYYAYR